MEQQKNIIEQKLFTAFRHREEGSDEYNQYVRLFNAITERGRKGLKQETLDEIKAIAKDMVGWLDFREKKAIDEELLELEKAVKWRNEQIEKRVNYLIKNDLKACSVNKTDEQLKEFKESLKELVASEY